MSSSNGCTHTPIRADKAVCLFVIRHVFGLVAIPLVFPRLADLVVHRLDVGLNPHLFEPGVVLFAFITRISNQTFWQLAGFSLEMLEQRQQDERI